MGSAVLAFLAAAAGMDATVLTTIVTTGGGIVVAIISLAGILLTRQGNINKGHDEDITGLREETESLRAKQQATEDKLRHAEDEIGRLRILVMGLGGDPGPSPWRRGGELTDNEPGDPP